MNRLRMALAACMLMACSGLCLPSTADELITAAGNIRACFIDLQEVLENYPEYAGAKTSLEDWAKPKKKLIEEKKAELEKLDKALKKGMLLSEDAKKEKENEFKNQLSMYQDLVTQVQSELAAKEEELLAPIKEKISQTIESISKSKGFNVVFDAAAPGGRPILYIDDALDITKTVVEQIKPAGDKKAKPAEKSGGAEKK